jgi:ribonuclease Z
VSLEDVSAVRPGQRFAFIMDTAPCPGAEELAHDVDLLVAECTFAEQERDLAAEYLHLTAGQAGTLARRAGAHELVLTHFSSRYPDVTVLRDEAAAQAPGINVSAAADLDRYPMPRRRAFGDDDGSVAPAARPEGRSTERGEVTG